MSFDRFGRPFVCSAEGIALQRERDALRSAFLLWMADLRKRVAEA